MLAHRIEGELRVSLHTVDDDTARSLLSTHRQVVLAAVRHYLPAASRAFHPLGPDELLSIAETAVLEAHVTYEPGDTSKETKPGARFAYWVGQHVFWRLGEVVARVRAAEPGVDARAHTIAQPEDVGVQRPRDAVPAAKLNGHEAQASCYRSELLTWLKTAIGRLPVRQRIIIASRLRGESQTDLAEQLGLSRGRISQEYRAALEALRTDALSRGFDSVALDA